MIAIIIILAFLCALTCIVEILPLLFLEQRLPWIKASLLCNVLTNPILNLSLALLGYVLPDQNALIVLLVVLEIAVVFFEAFLYHKLLGESYKKCLLISLICNTCSFGVGLLLSSGLYHAWGPADNEPFQPILTVLYL